IIKHKDEDGIFTGETIDADVADREYWEAIKDKSSVETLMQEYEKEAYEILIAKGYPLNWKELSAALKIKVKETKLLERIDSLKECLERLKCDHKKIPEDVKKERKEIEDLSQNLAQINDLKNMLINFKLVRDNLKKVNLEAAKFAKAATWNMALGIQAGMRAQVRKVEHHVIARIRQLHNPKEKKNKYILAYCKELMSKKPSPTAAHLFSRFPEKENAIVIEGAKIYREDLEDGERKIICIKPNGKFALPVGERAFFDYFLEVKNKFEP
ncbi:MAG TPA: hypothetical protein PKV48_03705, partial [Thermodesulfobacteriota bacterium]|nr:hypothetical protein [Thermodesulfobacteriota bacterium]